MGSRTTYPTAFFLSQYNYTTKSTYYTPLLYINTTIQPIYDSPIQNSVRYDDFGVVIIYDSVLGVLCHCDMWQWKMMSEMMTTVFFDLSK